MRGKLIVFTGLDGSGTSSVAEELHKTDSTSTLFSSIGDPYTICRDQINRRVGIISPSAHYLFYLSAVVYSSALIEEKLKTGNVYCVRYLIDTVVSHRVAGLNVNLVYETDSYKIIQPDLIIFLDVNESLRQERLEKRGKGYLDRKLDNTEFRLRFLAEFQKLSSSFVAVQVSGKSIAQISEEIMSMINR